VTSPGQGAVRVLRGSVLAACCTLLALCGHVLGGGSVSSVLAMLVVAAPLGAAFVIWADRERGPVQMAVAGLGSQVAFHLVFALCAGPGHQEASGLWMLTGHLLAAAVVARLLSGGEAALWSLYRALRAVVVRWVIARPGAVRVPTAARLVDVGLPARRELVLARAHPRRGPPRALAV
jgi:hypothetical protein